MSIKYFTREVKVKLFFLSVSCSADRQEVGKGMRKGGERCPSF